MYTRDIKQWCYRGIDPCEDTESGIGPINGAVLLAVTGASIRVRILKVYWMCLKICPYAMLQGHRSV